MRAFIVCSYFIALLGCTKPNPNRCCIDAADCTAKNIPVSSTCGDGLVCRGNQCIAETCTASSDCESLAPFCVNGLCGSTCTDDSQCPGASQDPSDRFCVSSVCVACRNGANDCPTSAPVCEMNMCRGCTANADCASGLCDTEVGTCFDAGAIVYAAPTGGATALCTQADPCTIARAWTVATNDPARNTIKLAAGSYPGAGASLQSGTLTVYGESPALTTIAELDATGGTLRIRNLTVNYVPGTWASVGAPKPTIDLDNVVCDGDDCIYANPAIFVIRRTRISCPSGCGDEPILASGNSTVGNGGSDVTLDQCVIQGGSSTGWAISLSNGSSFHMTNSVVIGYGTSYELQRLITGTPGASNVSFSTMYNAHLDCGTSATPWLLSDDNIFFVDVGGAPANTVSGTACSHNYDIIKPQSTNPGGTGNQVGIDPKFVSASTGDLHLMSTSPAINAANPAVSNITYDYEGTPRPQGAANDIGAYEYH